MFQTIQAILSQHQDNRGVTALHIANSYDGTSEIIQLLLEYGANPGIKDNLGKVYLM